MNMKEWSFVLFVFTILDYRSGAEGRSEIRSLHSGTPKPINAFITGRSGKKNDGLLGRRSGKGVDPYAYKTWTKRIIPTNSGWDIHPSMFYGKEDSPYEPYNVRRDGPVGPNNWERNGQVGPNNWERNGAVGPNNWERNGPVGPNNWGRNGPVGPNNWERNGPVGPNNWERNGPVGPNSKKDGQFRLSI